MNIRIPKYISWGMGALLLALCLSPLGTRAFSTLAVKAQQQSSPVVAQNWQGARPQNPPQAVENLPELQVQENFPADAAFKQDCQYAKLYEQTGGKIDNFGGGPDPVQLSPELAAFLATKPSVRQFDNGNGDAVFGHSFQFETCFKDCRLCGAQLELELKADGIPANNDVVYLYGKNINSGGLLWSGKAVAGKMIVNLPPKSLAKLNDYLCRNQSAKPWVNLLTQDDHKVNYAKLRVWYF